MRSTLLLIAVFALSFSVHAQPKPKPELRQIDFSSPVSGEGTLVFEGAIELRGMPGKLGIYQIQMGSVPPPFFKIFGNSHKGEGKIRVAKKGESLVLSKPKKGKGKKQLTKKGAKKAPKKPVRDLRSVDGMLVIDEIGSAGTPDNDQFIVFKGSGRIKGRLRLAPATIHQLRKTFGTYVRGEPVLEVERVSIVATFQVGTDDLLQATVFLYTQGNQGYLLSLPGGMVAEVKGTKKENKAGK